MPVSVLFAAFTTVLGAELVGDKTIYTLGSLATRYRRAPVLAGVVPAFMLKMGAAVLFGRAIGELPPRLVAGMSAVTFVAMGIVLWFKREAAAPAAESPVDVRWPRAMAVAFGAIFFSEWADPGQIAAATIAARFAAPVTVWIGGTLAMLTKAVFSVHLGVGLRRFLPRRTVRYLTLAVVAVMAILSVVDLVRGQIG
jgi:putative Ca2+/H+ antiporter (TMEM165/GDT1 family)